MTKDRLLRRAQLVARLHHPNLARMLPLPGGAGLTPVTNGARRLADFSTADGAFGELELEQVVWLLLDVLSGLRALHELTIDGNGFVHGAISPQYVLLGEPGTARLVPVTSAHLSATVAPETSGYAAPEALLGDTAEQRADLFSVGVLLWEALAQRRLFPDGSRKAVMACLNREQTPALRSLVSEGWAMPLCQVAERAIAVAPGERFGSALALSSAIVAAVGPRLTSPKSSRRAEAPTPTPTPTPVLEPTPRIPRYRTATPMSVVFDLPPPPMTSPAATVDSERATPPLEVQPPLSAHWQRWQPVLASLAVVLVAFGIAQMVPRRAPHAAQRAVAATPALTALAPVPSELATEAVSAPLPSTTTTVPTPSAASSAGSSAAASSARKIVARKPRSKLSSTQHADGDYGI